MVPKMKIGGGDHLVFLPSNLLRNITNIEGGTFAEILKKSQSAEKIEGEPLVSFIAGHIWPVQ